MGVVITLFNVFVWVVRVVAILDVVSCLGRERIEENFGIIEKSFLFTPLRILTKPDAVFFGSGCDFADPSSFFSRPHSKIGARTRICRVLTNFGERWSAFAKKLKGEF